MPQKQNITDQETSLQDKINRAKDAEDTGDFFRASFFYKDALTSAIKLNSSSLIKFCKNKVVEMNKESIASGKDLKEFSFTQELPEDKKKAHEEFKKAWGEDLCRQIKFILFEQMGYRLRHKVAHGEIEASECNFQNTTLILYLYLVLLARIGIK